MLMQHVTSLIAVSKKNWILTLLLFVWIHPVTSNAQTASDYYLPMCEGNFLYFNTTSSFPGNDSGGWAPRWILYKIHKPAIINGKTYYMQKGTEILHQAPDSSVFHRTWLRKDEQGNIMIGAYSGEYDNPDSAFKLPVEMTFFPNSFLTAGNKIVMDEGSGRISVDSVVSTTATVGSYTNCIQVRTTTKKNDTLQRVTDYYYAYKVGHVRTTRIFPYYQVHQTDLINHLSTNCYTSIDEANQTTNTIAVYPNPADRQLIFNLPGNPDNSTVRIWNNVGQLVKEVSFSEQNLTLNTSDWNNGLYLISLTTNGQTTYTRVLVAH